MRHFVDWHTWGVSINVYWPPEKRKRDPIGTLRAVILQMGPLYLVWEWRVA
jgi:hypothetical protein